MQDHKERMDHKIGLRYQKEIEIGKSPSGDDCPLTANGLAL